MIGPTPLLDAFRRGEAARDVKMVAASGALAVRAYEQLSILVLLTEDTDPEVRDLAGVTLNRIPPEAIRTFFAQPDVPPGLREFFVQRGILPEEAPAVEAPVVQAEAADADLPLIDTDPSDPTESPDAFDDEQDDASADPEAKRQSIEQRLSAMGFTEKLKAAAKGSKEMRAILIRDPSKMIAAAVLSSPKVTDVEVAGFARMGNVSEDVLRTICHNRSWLKNYSVVIALMKNPKTPVAMSLNLLARLSNRDAVMLATDRNIPEALRAAARKRATAAREK